MALTLTWLDYAERDRRRALDVIDLFRETGTVDELGQVVPKAIATVVSYDVERRIFPRFDLSIRNTPEERRRRRPLRRFAYSNERLTGMPVLGILYPSPSLAGVGDPALAPEGAGTLDVAVARARAGLEAALVRFTKPYLDAPREDESWYWAAPILLDLESHGESTRDWFGRPDLASKWTGAEEDDDEGSRWAEHVEETKKLVDAGIDAPLQGALAFGRPPADLAEALAMRSVAGPATSALRALTRASGPQAPAATGARDAAARIAWSFRKLEGQVRQAFNSPFWPFVLASTSVGQEDRKGWTSTPTATRSCTGTCLPTPSTSSSAKAAYTATRGTPCARTSRRSTGPWCSETARKTHGAPCSRRPGSTRQPGAG